MSTTGPTNQRIRPRKSGDPAVLHRELEASSDPDPLHERRLCWEEDCRRGNPEVRTVEWRAFTVVATCHDRTYRRRDMVDGRPGRWV